MENMLRYAVFAIVMVFCSAQNGTMTSDDVDMSGNMTEMINSNISMSGDINGPDSNVRVAPSTEMPTTTAAPTTTAPPPTVPRETLPVIIPGSVVDERGCFAFRPLDDVTKFQQFSDGVWFNYTCPSNLVWDQNECSCQARPVVIDDPNCPGYRVLAGDPTKYERQVHGTWLDIAFPCPANQIWSQDNCRCDHPPAGFVFPAAPALRGNGCFPMFNATFDTGIKDDSPHRRGVGRIPWEAVTLAPEAAGSNNGAARVKRGSLRLWFTSSNDFGSKFQFKIRFRLMAGSAPDGESISLMSNQGCPAGRQTIAMSYKPSTHTYSVFMRTSAQTGVVSCEARGEAYGWHTFGMTYVDNMLTLTVDGSTCTTSDFFSDRLVPTTCYMGFGGFNFDGYIDDSTVRKDCVDPSDM